VIEKKKNLLDILSLCYHLEAAVRLPTTRLAREALVPSLCLSYW
jgi:hypothetical protein